MGKRKIRLTAEGQSSLGRNLWDENPFGRAGEIFPRVVCGVCRALIQAFLEVGVE